MSADKTPTVADKSLSGYIVTSGLHALLEAVAAEIRTVPLVNKHGIRVLPEYAGDMYNQMNRVINKQLSLLVMVALETANKGNESIVPWLKDVRLQVHVYEGVLMNESSSGTRVPALAVAERVCARLHNYQPPASASLTEPQPLFLSAERTLGLNADESQPMKGMVCYTARFRTSTCICSNDD